MKILTFTLLFSLCWGCAPKVYQTNSQESFIDEPKYVPKPIIKRELAYFVWENDAFQQINPDPKPVSKLGEDGILRSLYSDIKYPSWARENGIQGDVLVSVTVDENGKVENIAVKEAIGGGCDEEAVRALKKPLGAGFEPFIWNGKPVKFRIDMPVRYRLE